jgi:DNA-binding transcriptional LysR family regulator
MVRKIDWENQIGRRLRLRDLHVFFAVAQRGSMAKAAAQLRVSTPTVSQVIAELEHGLGVRLLDRSPQGVELTRYGQALLKRTAIIFDELKQTIKDIEYLADPTVGEVRIACGPAFAATVLPQVIQRFNAQFPRTIVQQDDVINFEALVSGLRDRKCDFALNRLDRPLAPEENDLHVEVLFHDRMVLAAGTQTRWARRRKIELSELTNEQWILSAPDTWNYARVAEAFQARGLPMPRASTVTLSLQLRAHLLCNGPYIASIAASSLELDAARDSIKVLPVDLPDRTTPVAIITLKNRTLSPAVEHFIEYVRNVTQTRLGRRTARL